MSTPSCCVCLLECDYVLKCSKRCNAFTCYECVSTMITYYEFTIKCPECNSFYYSCELNAVDRDNDRLILNMKEYETKLIKTITKIGEDELNNYILQDKIVNKIREDRKLYIGHTFPKAIQLIVDICYEKDMKKVNKDNIAAANKYKPKVNCKNVICKGVMTQNGLTLRCDYCKLEICIECEKTYNPNHQCLSEDLESINMIKQYIKCPKCNIPVEKIDGCNDMTCGRCNTNFDYITGGTSKHGSHNKTPIKLKETKSIFDILNTKFTDVETINVLKMFESNAPLKPSIELVYKAIIRDQSKIFYLFDQYLYTSVLYKKYIDKLNLIIDLDKTETLTYDKILSICCETNKTK